MQRILLAVTLAAAIFCLSCVDKRTPPPAPPGGQCVDVNGVPITGANGAAIPAGSEQCAWILKNLDGKPPCRTEQGRVIYNELNRPFPDGEYCPQIREWLKREQAVLQNRQSRR